RKGSLPTFRDYFLFTLHRPINTDNQTRLFKILTEVNQLTKKIIFPLHPRTRQNMEKFSLTPEQFPNIHFLPPQGFLEMIQLQCNATRIITDSGGVQKEAYLNRIPCITLRNETEWPETLQQGWNQLVFDDLKRLTEQLRQEPQPYVPDIYGDGFVAPRMVECLKIRFQQNGLSSRSISTKKLFVLIPVYNEAKNLPRLLSDLKQLKYRLPQYQLEIILSDDGSQDATPQIAQEIAPNEALTILGDGSNHGPGYAFGTGFAYLEEKIDPQDIVVTMEGDNTSRLETLLAMIDRLEREDWESILASPYAYGGGITQTNWFRILLSMMANLLVRFVLRVPGIFTTSSFFRVFRGRLILRLQARFGARIVCEKGFVSMVELLKKMTLVQATISEYPMVLDTSRRLGYSKMKIYKTTLEYLKYLFCHSEHY
ncbi:MAG: UDP-N-acetylglucosamine 2-epimerase, partial [Planctomycetota bacterium]